MKENYWKTVEKKGKREEKRKKGEKRENCRKNEKKGEKWRRKEDMGEKERMESREAQRAVGLLHMSLEFCLPFLVRLCLKSDHVRTVSKKRCKIEQSETQDCHHNRRQQVLNSGHVKEGSCREVFT